LGNDELTEEFRFKNVLKELIEKTLQLTFAPNLDMSHRGRSDSLFEKTALREIDDW